MSLLTVSRRLFKELRKENVAACTFKLFCHVLFSVLDLSFFFKAAGRSKMMIKYR